VKKSDLKKLEELGFTPNPDWADEKYVLVCEKSAKEALFKSVSARMKGKYPVIVVFEFPCTRKAMTMNQHDLRMLPHMSRHILTSEVIPAWLKDKCPECHVPLKETSMYCPGCGIVVA